MSLVDGLGKEKTVVTLDILEGNAIDALTKMLGGNRAWEQIRCHSLHEYQDIPQDFLEARLGKASAKLVGTDRHDEAVSGGAFWPSS